jgi:hypothetical protein
VWLMKVAEVIRLLEGDGALHGGALLAVDVLCVGEPYRVEVLCAELDVPV